MIAVEAISFHAIAAFCVAAAWRVIAALDGVARPATTRSAAVASNRSCDRIGNGLVVRCV
jgi:hypothetical protein